MASTMQLSWVSKSTVPVALSRRVCCQCQPPLWLPWRIGFVTPVPLVRRVSSERVAALRVSCSKETESDVVEGESGGFAETEMSYTCVMKFGGSSVANAERMREVANLILSFPEERPIIVLSAMGKTTNMLLLVLFFSLFNIFLLHSFGVAFWLWLHCRSMWSATRCN